MSKLAKTATRKQLQSKFGANRVTYTRFTRSFYTAGNINIIAKISQNINLYLCSQKQLGDM